MSSYLGHFIATAMPWQWVHFDKSRAEHGRLVEVALHENFLVLDASFSFAQ